MKIQRPASRAQIGAAVKDLEDARGNKDRVWDNEGPSTRSHSAFERLPLAKATKAALSVGLSSRDEIEALRAFVAGAEATWGTPAVDPDVAAKMDARGAGVSGEYFTMLKAIELTRIGRSPHEVKDGFVSARGKVGDREIAAREVFVQQFAPREGAKPTGKVVVLSPGFQETGRNFADQIDQMCRAGHTVIAMDHQWAGQSDGKPGGIDSGFGVARDVAAVAAHASAVAAELFGGAGTVELYGNSMGAGAGVLSAAVLNDHGAIELEGAQMPRGLSLRLQAPYLEPTDSVTNKLLVGMSDVPLLNKIAVPANGVLPDTADDRRQEELDAQLAVQTDTRAQLSAFSAVSDDLSFVMGEIEAGRGPTGDVRIVHGDGDTLASHGRSAWLAETLGDRASLTTLNTSDHVLQFGAHRAVGPQMLDSLSAGDRSG